MMKIIWYVFLTWLYATAGFAYVIATLLEN